MPTTNYGPIDLTNITAIVGPAFTNCADIGSAPLTPNFSGSFSDPSVVEPGINSYTGRVRGEGTWTADIVHSTPTNPIPPGARIRRVRVEMQFSANTNSASMTGATYVGGGVATTNTAAQVTLQPLPSPANSLWITDFDIVNDIDTDQVVGTPATVSSSLNLSGDIIHIEYDFTTNPNGDFPLGYMTYADFLTNFDQIVFDLLTLAEVTVSFSAPPGNITAGVAACGGSLQASNWAMEVEWVLETSWTLENSTITLPDNVITLTRPEPIGEDTEQIEKIRIGDVEIEPNDPWVIIWTTLTIRLHLPPDVVPLGDPDIELFFVGTQFSGVVAVIPLTIIDADLSGIYVLDVDLHHDILYERTATPTTQNVLIPAPFFVTHFADTPESDITHCAGTRMRITGSGTVKQVAQSLDYIQTVEFGNNVLRTSNNKSPFSIVNFQDQHTAVRVYMDEYDDFMKVDQLLIFIKPVFTGYPQ